MILSYQSRVKRISITSPPDRCKNVVSMKCHIESWEQRVDESSSLPVYLPRHVNDLRLFIGSDDDLSSESDR